MTNKYSSNYKSIRFKLFLLYSVVVLLPTLILGVWIYGRSTAIARQDASTLICNSLANLSDNIDNMLRNIEYLSMPLSTSEEFVMNVKRMKPKEEIHTYADFTDRKNLTKYIYDMSFMSPYITSIYVLNPSADTLLLSVGSERVIDTYSKKHIPWMLSFAGLPKTPSKWFAAEAIEAGIGEKKYILSYLKPIIEFGAGKTIGTYAVNINEATIYQLLGRLKLGVTGFAFLVDSQGVILSHADKQYIGKMASEFYPFIKSIGNKDTTGYKSYTQHGRDYVMNYYTSSISSMHYIAIVPQNEITGNSFLIRNFIIIIFILFIILTILGAFLISQQFYRPMGILLSHMKAVENGVLSVSIKHKRTDEFGYVFDRFNKMVSRLKISVEELFTQKLLKKDAELKAIQSQINEHFLYNTLDCIYWMSRLYKADKISHMVTSLSKYFRLNLSGGNDIVTVDQVVKLITYYLDIQKIRFENKLNVSISMDEDIKDCFVLKYIFQPIVENAVLHGIEKKKGSGSIAISFEKAGDIIRFKVSDDGAGISNKKLQDLLKCLQDDTMPTGDNFALKNINAQIRIAYKENYGIHIKSIEGEGTEVTAEIPIIARVEEGSDD